MALCYAFRHEFRMYAVNRDMKIIEVLPGGIQGIKGRKDEIVITDTPQRGNCSRLSLF